MSSSARIERGAVALRRVLREQTSDVRTLDLPGFRLWLKPHLERWGRDPVFQQRSRIRDLRRRHPALHVAEKERRRAAAADAGSLQFSALQTLERELMHSQRAIAGLTGALDRSGSGKQASLKEKLKSFRDKRRGLKSEYDRLSRSSPERQALLRADAELKRLRSTTRLGREEACLGKLLLEQGRRSGRSGNAFEERAIAAAHDLIVPELVRSRTAEVAGRVLVLHGVRLGLAKGEFDQLIVRLPRGQGRPADVIGMVEVKRNINDLGHGFRQRQQNLAWLTGDAAHYDPAAHRTRHFRSGHFDREAVHRHEGGPLVFTRDSFRLFHRDSATGHFLARLYWITRPGPVWGTSASALGRMGHRIATDEHWDPESERSLRRLLHWCQSLAEPLETPDVLRLYASNSRLAKQVLLVQN